MGNSQILTILYRNSLKLSLGKQSNFDSFVQKFIKIRKKNPGIRILFGYDAPKFQNRGIYFGILNIEWGSN